MKQSVFLLGFFLFPLIPVVFYFTSAGAFYDTYSVSIVLGVYSFVLVCNQFYLASQPSWLISFIGVKFIRSLHGSSPLLLLLLSSIHAILKLSIGFTITTIGAILGLTAFILFFVGIFSALLLFANTLLTKRSSFSKFRVKIFAKMDLTHQKVRAIHNLMVVAGLFILIHALLASTSTFTYNPIGVSILIVWMLFTLFVYLAYRLSGRKKRGK
ncbi:MAG: hypothetical protein EOM67_05115 [Spirochaetia bacterium]|nr:hypothetical protein [Spirochaetia bacterium]